MATLGKYLFVGKNSDKRLKVWVNTCHGTRHGFIRYGMCLVTLSLGWQDATSQRFDLDVYQKSSNQFLFLPYDSYHPDHVFQGWIRGYLGRLRINCTDDIIYHVRRSQFWSQLLERGYAELDLSTYFQYDPLRSVLIAKIRTTPKNAPERSQKTFFKIRHSPRTTQLMHANNKTCAIRFTTNVGKSLVG